MKGQPTPVLQTPEGASSVEVYGFVGWVTSMAVYCIYLVWAYTPEKYLQAVGITYYPSKEWAVIIPTWLCVVVAFVFWAYECINMCTSLSPEDRRTLEDATPQWSEEEVQKGWEEARGIPPLKDVPPAIVSECLYLKDAGISGGVSERKGKEEDQRE